MDETKGANKSFSIGEALGFGWDVMKKNFWFFAGYLVIYFVVEGILSNINNNQSLSAGVRGFVFLIYMLVTVLFVGWQTKMSLKFANGEKGEYSDINVGLKQYLNLILSTLVTGIVVILGLILLVFPGIIWGLTFSMTQWLVIDKKIGAFAALRESSRITRGVKWQLFVFGLACFGVMILGLLALGLGIFAAFPTVIIAEAYVYKKLSGQSVSVPSNNQPIVNPADLVTRPEQIVQ